MKLSFVYWLQSLTHILSLQFRVHTPRLHSSNAQGQTMAAPTSLLVPFQQKQKKNAVAWRGEKTAHLNAVGSPKASIISFHFLTPSHCAGTSHGQRASLVQHHRLHLRTQLQWFGTTAHLVKPGKILLKGEGSPYSNREFLRVAWSPTTRAERHLGKLDWKDCHLAKVHNKEACTSTSSWKGSVVSSLQMWSHNMCVKPLIWK